MGYNTPAFHKAGDIVLPHTRTRSTVIGSNAPGVTPLCGLRCAPDGEIVQCSGTTRSPDAVPIRLVSSHPRPCAIPQEVVYQAVTEPYRLTTQSGQIIRTHLTLYCLNEITVRCKFRKSFYITRYNGYFHNLYKQKIITLKKTCI